MGACEKGTLYCVGDLPPSMRLFPTLFHFSNGGNSCAKIWETKALRRNNEEMGGRKKGVTFRGVTNWVHRIDYSFGGHNGKGSLLRDVMPVMLCYVVDAPYKAS